jgi:hypothetical protein
MTQFIRLADIYRLAPNSAFSVQGKLPAATYALKLDKEGYFLQVIDNFDLPSKLYGDCTRNADRIIQTFWDRPNSTGLFLEGEKGSGKTLLAKKISLDMIAVDVPTIVVNEPHFGEGFNTFIQSIDQPAVVMFDEFEKIYSNQSDEFNVNAQERVLTLFDGVYPTKKLFIVTCNDSWRIDKNMKNRPGRMYYMLSFKGLDDSFIREYATENLVDRTKLEGIFSIVTMFGSFNFDMLKSLVEEMNRYGETAQEAIKLLNVKPQSEKSSFDIHYIVDGKAVELTKGYEGFSGNPLNDDVSFNIKDEKTQSWDSKTFLKTDLVKVDGSAGTFHYKNHEGEELLLSRKKYEIVDWSKYVVN